MAGGDSATIELDGHRLALTHLRKVLYPATGTTKSEIIAYFAEVAHVIIPHLADRPVTRKRWPDGVTTTPFFHKDLPRGTPSWVTRRTNCQTLETLTFPLPLLLMKMETDEGALWMLHSRTRSGLRIFILANMLSHLHVKSIRSGSNNRAVTYQYTVFKLTILIFTAQSPISILTIVFRFS